MQKLFQSWIKPFTQKRLALGFFGMMCLSLIMISSFGQVSNERFLIIAGDENYPPFEFLDHNDGSFRGLNNDVMTAISIETGVEIKLVPMKWDDAKKALRNGEVDAIQGMIKTDSREAIYDFSDPFIDSSQVIFVREDTNYISDLKDLQNNSISIQKGDVNAEIVNGIKGARVEYFDDQEDAIKALMNKQVEAFLGNKMTGIYTLQRLKQIDSVKIVGEPIKVNDYCAAVQKGDAETLKILNEGIMRVKSNGTLDKIVKKWFGEIVETGEKWKQLAIWVGAVAILLGLMLMFIGWINRRLKNEVNKRTREIQEMNEALHSENLQKWHIINSITNGIAVFDKGGCISLYNQSACDIMNKDLSIGLSWRDIPICELIGIGVFEKAMQEKSEFRSNLAYSAPNGVTTYVDFSITPISYDSELKDEIILLVHDYTQEKIFHDVLSQNEKLSTIGRMSASIAHELRNPLSSIRQYIDLMPSKLNDSRFMNQVLKVIPSELNRLNDIIDHFLDYTKFTETKKGWVPVKELTEDLMHLLKVELVNRRIRLILDIEPISVFCDIKHLKQVLINLIINAMEAIDQDGAIKIVAMEKSGYGIIQVVDNGHGINENDLNEVFQPYYSTKESGSGIGLAICKQLVEENEGTISLQSKPMEGTTVTLMFLLPETPSNRED